MEQPRGDIQKIVGKEGDGMLIHGPLYLQTLQRMLEGVSRVSIAVAFWGEGAESLFSSWQGDSLRIICNLAQGGTNPAAVRRLQMLRNAEVRQLSDLHAKIVLTERDLVVGSANVSANGLGLEGCEVAGWREIGLVSQDAQLCEQAAEWFESQWAVALSVTQVDLDRAQTVWAARRRGRPHIDSRADFLSQSAEALKDRPVYIAIYRSFVSPRAEAELNSKKQAMRDEGGRDALASGLEVFEGWASNELPSAPDASLIQVYWGPRGRIAVSDVLRPVPELMGAYEDDDSGEPIRLDYLVKRDSVGPWSFSKSDRTELARLIRPWVLQLGMEDGLGRCIPAFEWREWQEAQGNVAGR